MASEAIADIACISRMPVEVKIQTPQLGAAACANPLVWALDAGRNGPSRMVRRVRRWPLYLRSFVEREGQSSSFASGIAAKSAYNWPSQRRSRVFPVFRHAACPRRRIGGMKRCDRNRSLSFALSRAEFPHASFPLFPADPEGDAERGGDRLASADAARRHDPAGGGGHLRLAAARPPGRCTRSSASSARSRTAPARSRS